MSNYSTHQNKFQAKYKQFKKLPNDERKIKAQILANRIMLVLNMILNDEILYKYFKFMKYKNFCNLSKFEGLQPSLNLTLRFDYPWDLYYHQKQEFSDDEINHIVNKFQNEFPELQRQMEYTISTRNMIEIKILW